MHRLDSWSDEEDLWFWAHLQELESVPLVPPDENGGADDVSVDGSRGVGRQRIPETILRLFMRMRRSEP